jgi:hypothetical protein
MNVDTVNVDKIVINEDNIGGLRAAAIKTQMNLGMRAWIIKANIILADFYITIPNTFTKYFALSDVVISYFDDYLMLGLTIIFVDPTQPSLYSAEDEDFMLQY